MKVIEGNLLEAKEKYIVHQTNCVSISAAGLAAHMFKTFPYSDVYSCRNSDNSSIVDKPGDIIIRGDGKSERYVIALMGQYYPGAPRYPGSSKDGFEARLRYFEEGLLKIMEIKNLDSVAFPWQIGCGLAGGDWKKYKKLLRDFSKINDNVTIYRLPGQ